MRGVLRFRSSGLAALAAGSLACQASRVYVPTTPHAARTADTELVVRSITVAQGAPALPRSPANFVGIDAHYRAPPGVVLAFPRVASAAIPPCTGGVESAADARVTTRAATSDGASPGVEGDLYVSVPRHAVDEVAPLGAAPAVLDVVVLHAAGLPPGCMRAPLVEEPARPEWQQPATGSFGLGLGVTVPFQRIYGVAAMPTLMLRGGRWFGPVRLRLQGVFGGAYAQTSNPNLEGYAYGGGVLADVLALHVRQFGLGLAAGYDALGISFAPTVDALSHDGAGFQGLMHGPRAGLVFAMLPPPPPGPAFRARPDATSVSLEIYGSALWSAGSATATPAIWAALQMDGGF